MNKIIVMWCHPRSMSTAVERLMRARGDLQCLHEPFMYYHYLNQANRDMPYFNPKGQYEVTFEGIKQMILSKAKQSPLFVKDMSYYISAETSKEPSFNQRLTHTFLVRNPEASIASYYALDNNVTLKEIGIEAQWHHHNQLTEMGITPVIIQAERFSQNPRDYAARWWSAIDLDYDNNAFNWKDECPEEWEPVKTWHSSVLASSSIRAPAPDVKLKLQERFNRAVDEAPHLLDYLHHHRPYYEKLVSLAI